MYIYPLSDFFKTHILDFSRLAFLVVVVLIVVVVQIIPLPQLTLFSEPIGNHYDPKTGLPIIGQVFYPDQLPDGHYTVAEALPRGLTVVVQHLPGPDRDFAWYVMNAQVANFPDQARNGDRFTIFCGQPV